MPEARPTDHLEPAAKKRGSDRQITKDDESDSGGDQEEQGTFARASEDVLKQRRIVRARRSGQPKAAPTAAPAAANPFSGIQLSAGDAKPGAANPFAGIQLTASKPAVPEASASPADKTAPAGDAHAPEPAPKQGAGAPTDAVQDKAAAAHEAASDAGEAETKADDSAVQAANGKEVAPGDTPASRDDGPAAATAAEAATKAPMLGGFAVLSGSTPLFGGLSSGGQGGGFGSLASKGAPAAFSFGGAAATGNAGADKDGNAASSAPLFSFSAGAAAPAFSFKPPADAPVLSPPTEAGAQLGGLAGSVAPEAPQATGEETESLVFSGEGVLFEFDAAKQWRERGAGEVRVLVSAEEPQQARLVMRQKGNLRLLMNANLWADMPVAKMEGGKGATFAVVNAVGADGASDTAPESSKDAALEPKNGQLATFALRIKHPDVLAAFLAALETYKKPKSTSF